MGATKKTRLQRLDHKRRLLRWLVEGKTMVSFCRRKCSPTIHTVYEWLRKDLSFSEDVREAKFVGYDVMAQSCIDIADNGGEDGEGQREDVPRDKIRIWTRLQLLARWDSARYGDRILVGGDGGDPIRVMNDSQVMTEIMGLLALAKTRQLSEGIGPNGNGIGEGIGNGKAEVEVKLELTDLTDRGSVETLN
jgi:hypothetical protein